MSNSTPNPLTNSFKLQSQRLTKSNYYDIFGSVPYEIAESIANHLHPFDIIRLERVSKKWRFILHSESIYLNAFKRVFETLKFSGVNQTFETHGVRKKVRATIRKQMAWMKHGPIMRFTLKKDDNLEWLQTLFQSYPPYLRYLNNRIVIQGQDCISIISLIDLKCFSLKIPDGISNIKLGGRFTLLKYDRRVVQDGEEKTLSTLFVIDCEAGVLKYELHPCFPTEVICCNDNIIVAAGDWRVSIWNASTGEQIEELGLLRLMERKNEERNDEEVGDNDQVEDEDEIGRDERVGWLGAQITSDNTIVLVWGSSSILPQEDFCHLFFISTRFREYVKLPVYFHGNVAEQLYFGSDATLTVFSLNDSYYIQVSIHPGYGGPSLQYIYISYTLKDSTAKDRYYSDSISQCISPALGYYEASANSVEIKLIGDDGTLTYLYEIVSDGWIYGADENWIVKVDWNKRSVYILGFDDIKCHEFKKALKTSSISWECIE